MEVVAIEVPLYQAIENSFEGFEIVIKNGVKRIETDILVSKDDIPFIIHDNDLERLTGTKLKLESSSAEQIEKLQLKDGSKIPRLSEILTKFANQVEWNLEIKSESIDHAKIIIDYINSTSTNKKIIISSFNHELIFFLAKNHPQYEYALLWEEIESNEKVIDSMNKAKCSYIHPEFKIITKDFMDLCSKNNWKVVPYISIKDEKLTPSYISKLLELNLSGMCTNFPLELINEFK